MFRFEGIWTWTFQITWIPVRIEHDKTISTYQIQTTATRFTAEHKYEVRALYFGKITVKLNHTNYK